VLENRLYTYQEVKFKLEQWCAYQDRCTYEVAEKIKKFNLNEVESQKLITELKDSRFLDDDRFVSSFISGKFNIKRWGRVKIKHHLIQKRIDKLLIQKHLYEIDESQYTTTIKGLILKKNKELKAPLSEYQKQAKLVNYLSSKGFEIDVILDCYNLLKMNNFKEI
jgi:regulatory protein